MRPISGGTSILAVALIGVLWGLNWPAVKFLLSEIEPLTIRAVSFTLAALFIAIVVKWMGLPLRPERSEILPICLTGLFLIFGFNILTVLGQLLVDTTKAAIIAYTMPAITAVLAAIFLKDRIDRRIVFALLVGMAGLGVLASEDLATLAAQPTGPILMILAALSWAIGNVALKAREWTLPPLSLAVWFFAVSSFLVWPLVLVLEAPWQQSWPSNPILWTLAFHILGPMITCYVAWTMLVEQLPATVAAISTLTAPIVGVLSAAWLLGNPLTWHIFLSLAMIVISIALTLLRPSPK